MQTVQLGFTHVSLEMWWRTACNRVRAEQSSIGIAAFHDLANDIPRARAPFNDASRTQG
jgi:hypothetical protein